MITSIMSLHVLRVVHPFAIYIGASYSFLPFYSHTHTFTMVTVPASPHLLVRVDLPSEEGWQETDFPMADRLMLYIGGRGGSPGRAEEDGIRNRRRKPADSRRLWESQWESCISPYAYRNPSRSQSLFAGEPSPP